jgi:hypothetical protein
MTHHDKATRMSVDDRCTPWATGGLGSRAWTCNNGLASDSMIGSMPGERPSAQHIQ